MMDIPTFAAYVHCKRLKVRDWARKAMLYARVIRTSIGAGQAKQSVQMFLAPRLGSKSIEVNMNASKFKATVK